MNCSERFNLDSKLGKIFECRNQRLSFILIPTGCNDNLARWELPKKSKNIVRYGRNGYICSHSDNK